MTLRARLLAPVTVLVLMVAPVPVLAPVAHAVDVSTVGVNNTRQGWNKFETVLTPANVRSRVTSPKASSSFIIPPVSPSNRSHPPLDRSIG